MVPRALSRVLVGVVGGGEQPRLARLIGQLLVDRGAIVLTGGQGDPHEESEAKEVTLTAAIEHAKKTKQIARLVGILPGELGEKQVQWERRRMPTVRAVFLHTMLSSYQRDLINGVTPDAIIALKGGRGTLAEIGFAAFANVPVILADPNSFLKDKLLKHAEKLRTTIIPDATLKYPSFNGVGISADNIIHKLELALNNPKNTINHEQVSGSLEILATAVVDCAILRSQEYGTQARTRFPGLPGSPDSFERFYKELADLG